MYTHNIEVRYRDIDVLRHVSHVEYVTYMQQARLSYLTEELDMTAHGIDPVVVHLELDYERPIHRDDDVTVGVRCCDPGTTSFRTEYELRANGDIAATGTSVQAATDAETGEARSLPESWRALIEG